MLFNSKNHILNYLSAGNQRFFSENWVGTSETIRTLSLKDRQWLAGVMDGDGNFDIKKINGKLKLKSIRIVQSHRDVKILYRIKDLLKTGRIRVKTKTTFCYILSHKEGMKTLLEAINGEIRLKKERMQIACFSLNLEYKEASMIVNKNSSYLAGLIDSDGSIIYNRPGNRIDLYIELKDTPITRQLDISQVIPGAKINQVYLKKRNQTKERVFFSRRLYYSSVENMWSIYRYIKEHRLYSDFKFYRVMLIKPFFEVRPYAGYSTDSVEYQLYKACMIKFYNYKNEEKELPSFLK